MSAGVPDGGRPRYSTTPLPPYSYVSGFTPHPVSDPRGHMFGQPHVAAPPFDPSAWRQSVEYLYAVDLFNHGFYWEAHEAWESLWHAAGRRGPVAIWLKALIKLAAAGVKAREGNAVGVQRHARRSLELVGQLRRELPHAPQSFGGLLLKDVEAIGHSLIAEAPGRFANPQPAVLLNERLDLTDC
jgi:hypothetical protein